MENRKDSDGYIFVKNRYYPGKLLHASDFVREQEYGNAKLEFLNRRFHGWGIIQGLEVRTGENGSLHVTAGSAIDRRGRFIVVPEDVKIGREELEASGGTGSRRNGSHGFILGLRYEERQVDRERSLLCEKETYEAARIAESYCLAAYSDEDWRRLKAGRDLAAALTEERILYEDEEVRLSLCIPRVVPTDSIFKIRIQARALKGSSVNIGWRCTVKLQGAFFLTSGRSLEILEEQRTSLLGSLYQEWQICTEEYRKQMIAMELSRLEIFRNGAEPVAAEACQVSIETAEAYEEAVRKRLPREDFIFPEDFVFPEAEIFPEAETFPKPETYPGESIFLKTEISPGESNSSKPKTAPGGSIFQEDWVPLARIGVGADRGSLFVYAGENELRKRVAQSAETEILRRAAEESGILDIRWRGLLKSLRPETAGRINGSSWKEGNGRNEGSDRKEENSRIDEKVRADEAGRSVPAAPGSLPEGKTQQEEEHRGKEEYRAKGVPWGKEVHRGVAVIPVPKHYRKGDTLFSEEIAHGFPGEEVFLWLERIYEEPSYAYWEKNNTRHAAVHGADELFADGWYSGWEIRKQALRQEIEAGTFQIALVLSKGRRKKRSREVALSWTAVSLTRTT